VHWIELRLESAKLRQNKTHLKPNEESSDKNSYTLQKVTYHVNERSSHVHVFLFFHYNKAGGRSLGRLTLGFLLMAAETVAVSMPFLMEYST